MSKTNDRITFPAGEAVYPALSRPDTKFDELGQYKADFRLSEADALPYIEKLQAIIKAHTGKPYPKKKNPLWYYEIDNETGDETGYVVFKPRVKNKIRKNDGKLWDRKPLLIDSKKTPLSSDVNPWGGSTIKVQAEIYCYLQPKPGVMLQPLVVQVIDLVTGGSREDLSDFDEEDGYTASESDLEDFDNDDAETSAKDVADDTADY